MFAAGPEPRALRLAGSTTDVLIRRLHRGEGDETQSEVVFPPGWERPGAGCFDVAEEVVWLEGTLIMSGRTHRAGSYCFLPGGYPRVASRSPAGARALAWFSGIPSWSPLDPDRTDPQEELDEPDVQDPAIATALDAVPLTDGPLPGTRGQLLRDGRDGRRTWLLQGLRGGVLPDACLLVPLDGHRALPVAAGHPLPHVDDTLLLRTRSS